MRTCARFASRSGVLAWDFVTGPLLLKGDAVKRVHLSWQGAPGLGQPGKLPNMVGVCDACADEIISADCDVCVWSVGYFTRSPTRTS